MVTRFCTDFYLWGIRFGFSDLLTAKLLYRGGGVVEVNYILYMIKQIFYCSIPVISMIFISFMLSTITLHTTITIGITTVIIMISPFLWHFIQQLGLTVVAYTSVPYFMFSPFLDLSENYLKAITFVNISEGYGIFILIVTVFVCYYVSNMVFIKLDVRN